MHRERAWELAHSLMTHLRPSCERIQAAGSLRRQEPDVGDIELLAIPIVERTVIRDMFDAVVEVKRSNLLLKTLPEMETSYREGDLDYPWWVEFGGQRQVKLVHREIAGASCDLFMTDQDGWGLAFVIRTGPREFSRAITRLALAKGWMIDDLRLHQHSRRYDAEGKPISCRDGRDCKLIIPTEEEGQVFDALGLPWIDPEDRDPRLVEAVIAKIKRAGGAGS